MKNDFSIKDAINMALSAMKASRDFEDMHTTAAFMTFCATITEAQHEITELDDFSKFSLILSTIVSSSFVGNYPNYYNYSIGKLSCAAGFYAFMRQLDEGCFLNSHFPAFCVLLHYGRKYMAQLFEEDCISGKGSFSPYNPFDVMDLSFSELENASKAKAIELLILNATKNAGYSDENTERWRRELVCQEDDIRRNGVEDFFAPAKHLYHFIGEKLKTGTIADICTK